MSIVYESQFSLSPLFMLPESLTHVHVVKWEEVGGGGGGGGEE